MHNRRHSGRHAGARFSDGRHHLRPRRDWQGYITGTVRRSRCVARHMSRPRRIPTSSSSRRFPTSNRRPLKGKAGRLDSRRPNQGDRPRSSSISRTARLPECGQVRTIIVLKRDADPRGRPEPALPIYHPCRRPFSVILLALVGLIARRRCRSWYTPAGIPAGISATWSFAAGQNIFCP